MCDLSIAPRQQRKIVLAVDEACANIIPAYLSRRSEPEHRNFSAKTAKIFLEIGFRIAALR